MKRRLTSHLTLYQDTGELSTMAVSCLVVACLIAVTAAQSYSEVQTLGNSCPILDSCQHNRSRTRELFTIKDRNCACDYLCSYYGDCCIDAPSNEMPLNSSLDFTCHELRQFGGVYMRDHCPPQYSGPKMIKELCEKNDTSITADPLGSMPVTDSGSGLTYKNYFCGMCNGHSDNLVLWTPRLECPSLTIYNNSQKNLTHEYVFQNLETDGSGWGLYLDGDNGSLFFHDCDIDPVMPPLLESKIRLCKTQLISECPDDWTDDRVRELCGSYMGVRYLQGDRFKNAHCALCHRVNMTYLSCQAAEYREMYFFRAFERYAFSLLLDINDKMGGNVGTIEKCANGDIFDPFFKKCRSLLCLAGYARQGDECVEIEQPNEDLFEYSTVSVPRMIGDDTYAFNFRDDGNKNLGIDSRFQAAWNITNDTEPSIVTMDENDDEKLDVGNVSGVSHNLSALDSPFQNLIGKFKNCLLVSLENEDYIMLPNKSIYVPKYDKTYEKTNYHSRDGSVLICPPFVNESEVKFMPLMGYVTVIGLGISMLGLFMHFAAFCLVPDLRNLSGKNLVSQCFSLFCAYSCFIIGQFDALNFAACTAIAFLTFYFFQVSFFWMSTMAFDVWRTLKMATTELRVSGGRQRRRFAAYTFYSWFTPLFIILLAALAEYTDAFPEIYRPGFAQPRCWFRRRRALLVFFATPLIGIMVANMILFISSARMIVMTTKTTIKQQSQSQKRNFKLYLRLALLMGLTWAIGLIAGYIDSDVLWYLFIVMNTLQGLFIFVAFSCSTKVRNFLRERYGKTGSSRNHSASSGSGCNTNSTSMHSNIGRKLSTKLLVNSKNSASPTNSSISIS